jgi:hypothetical protein
MHGTGLISAIAAMLAGGTVITLEKLHFDPIETLDAIHQWKPANFTIVGTDTDGTISFDINNAGDHNVTNFIPSTPYNGTPVMVLTPANLQAADYPNRGVFFCK